MFLYSDLTILCNFDYSPHKFSRKLESKEFSRQKSPILSLRDKYYAFYQVFSLCRHREASDFECRRLFACYTLLRNCSDTIFLSLSCLCKGRDRDTWYRWTCRWFRTAWWVFSWHPRNRAQSLAAQVTRYSLQCPLAKLVAGDLRSQLVRPYSPYCWQWVYLIDPEC